MRRASFALFVLTIGTLLLAAALATPGSGRAQQPSPTATPVATASPAASPTATPSPAPTPTPVPLSLRFVSIDGVAWDDPGLGQTSMRVSGRARFTGRTCELLAKIPTEEVAFDDLLPGNATSYRVPGTRDAALVAPSSLFFEVQALDGAGRVLARGVIGLTDLPFVCPPELPQAGGPPGGSDEAAGAIGLALVAVIGGALLTAAAWRLGRPAP